MSEGTEANVDTLTTGTHVPYGTPRYWASTILGQIRPQLDEYQTLLVHVGRLSPETRSTMMRLACKDLILQNRSSIILTAPADTVSVLVYAVWAAMPFVVHRYGDWSTARQAGLVATYAYYVVASGIFFRILPKYRLWDNAPTKRIVTAALLLCFFWWYAEYGASLTKPYFKFVPRLPDEKAQTVGVLLAAAGFLASSVVRALAATLGRLAVEPLARRRWGSVPPTHAAALLVLRTLLDLRAADNWWANSLRRRQLIKRCRDHEREAEGLLVNAARACGGLRDDIARARLQAWHLSATLRHHRNMIIEAYSIADARSLVDELADKMTALVNGHWALILQDGEPTLRSRIRVAMRRLIGPVILASVAIGLPYLPGIASGTPGLEGVQLGLLATAALTLLPVDSGVRSSVLSALKDVAKLSSQRRQ